MSFLQPLLLAGLPLVSLPILIHLINRQRHRTIAWGAMMFLLDAKRLTRGMARLRYWLIMAMRMLAIAALVFAVARPLASGWIGLAVGGQADTTILLLDRSASMEQQDVQTGESKRSTGIRKLAELIELQGGGHRVVLIESTTHRPLELESADSLGQLAETSATATSADLPGMLQAALDYVVANESGRTDIWICSDLREHDWQVEDGRWEALRAGFERLEGVRFYLLSYPARPSDNLAVWVSNVRRRQLESLTELVLDVELSREGDTGQPLRVPIEFVINGARSVLNIEMTGSQHTLQGHTIALDESTVRGWGRVELPADANAQDNVSHFVFAEPPAHHTLVVSDDRRSAELLRLAAATPADPGLAYTAEIMAPDRIGEVDWEQPSLILWQAVLPEGVAAQQLRNFVQSGRPLICFPPARDDDRAFMGAAWGPWQQAAGDRPTVVQSWRGESDLLSHTRSGAPLPVGKLRTYRYREIRNGGGILARFAGGQPLLTRLSENTGHVYFCATLPAAEYSSLAQDGVVYYVMIHRALSLGAAIQSKARQLTAGTAAAGGLAGWQSLSPAGVTALVSARPFQAGSFQRGDELVALNRPRAEDAPDTLDDAALQRMFSGLDYRKVEDRVGDATALANEIWRAFLLAMAVALLVEAWLCLPAPRGAGPEVAA